MCVFYVGGLPFKTIKDRMESHSEFLLKRWQIKLFLCSQPPGSWHITQL